MRIFLSLELHNINRMIIFTLFACLLLKQPHLLHSQTTDVPIETIDPGFYDVLVALLPDDYEIVNDINTWNFTQIYNLLTEDNENLFYGLPTSALLQLPDSMLLWLGEEHPEIIVFHDLCNYLSNDFQIEYNCTSNTTVYDTSCPDPFVDSVRYSVFYDGCNLRCKYANLLWGMPDDAVNRLLIGRYISMALSFPCLVIVLINQYMDSQGSKEYFCQRPLITQSTFFIIVAFLNVFFQWLLIPMIGEDNVLCQDELLGQRGVSCMFGKIKIFQFKQKCVKNVMPLGNYTPTFKFFCILFV